MIGTRTRYTHSGVRLLVLGTATDELGRRWLRVVVPLRPNGRSAWILADHAQLRRVNTYVRINLRRRELAVWRDGRLVRRARTVVGAPRTPSPTGLTAIYEKVPTREPTIFTGPWALHLTSFSPVLDRYGAGDGRVAIHGRGPAALIDPLGTARSHGCIRLDNAMIHWLRVVLSGGTPVEIVAR